MNEISLKQKLGRQLSYTTKFIMMSILYFAALAFLLFGMYKATTGIHYSDMEQAGNRYQKVLRQLLEHIPQAKLYSYKLLSGNESSNTLLLQTELKIDQDFRDLRSIDKELENLLEITAEDFQKKEINNVKPIVIARNWEMLKQQILKNDTATINMLFDSLIVDLRSLIVYIGDTSFLILDPDIDSYYLIDNTLIRQPDVQDMLVQVMIISEMAIDQKTISVINKGQLQSKIGLIRANLSGSQIDLNKAFEAGKAKEDLTTRTALEGPFKNYDDTVNTFLTYVENKIIKSTEMPGDSKELEDLGQKAVASSFQMWDAVIPQINRLLEIRKNELFHKLYLRIGILLAISLSGFIFGIWVMIGINTPLKNLIMTSRRMAEGDLSARADITSNDELGLLATGFNKMAQSVQEIVNQLKNSVVLLSGYSAEIASATKEQETTITEQEVTTKEIASTAKGIYEVAKELASTMSNVNKTAEDTSALAASGQEDLSRMSSIMQQMVDASANIASKLAVLNEKAGNITGVITTITKVADQTNLLSLNAAIEAEKAGEHGRSFAVIAREIRRLADQTAYATLDIEKMVTEMGSAVSSGVMGVDKFSEEIRFGVNQVKLVSEQLSHIISHVQQQSAGIETVNQGMQMQAEAAEQITESIVQLSEATTQTSLSVHQFQQTIEVLNNSTKELQTSVKKISDKI